MPGLFPRFPFRAKPTAPAAGMMRGICVLALVLAAGCDGGPSEARPFAVAKSFGEVGTNPGQFVHPRVLTADPDGHLWVIDKAARIQRLDPETGRASVHFRTPEIALGRPCGMIVGPPPRTAGASSRPGDSLLYIADTHYHRVLIYDMPAPSPDGFTLAPEPELIGQFGRYGHGPGEFIYLTGIAFTTDDAGFLSRMYVSEYGGNDRISVWEPAPDGSWTFIFAFGSLGGSDLPDQIQFDRPQSIAIDQGRNRLIVTDSCNHRVGVFTLDGNLVSWIGSPRKAGSGAEQMAYPFGLHLLDDGSALVSEYGNHRVRHLDLETGELLGLYGSGGRAPGELLHPWAVTMMGRTVYVLDSGNERVQAFTLPGRRRSLAGGALP